MELSENVIGRVPQLSIEEIRKYPGNENLTDEEAENISWSLRELSIIAYDIFMQEERKLKDFRLIHEAAHAVAAFHYNVPFDSISRNYKVVKVEYTPTPKELKSIASRKKTAKIVRRLILVDCAGVVAEQKYHRKHDQEYWKDDVEHMNKYSKFLSGDLKENRRKCFEEIEYLFGKDSHSFEWEAVVAIAKELDVKEELSYDEAEKIYRQFVDARRKNKK